MESSDVVVVGAGPVGLMLAIELCAAGATPRVLDRRAARSDAPKANGIAGQAVRLLDCRGLLDPLRAAASFTGPIPAFPFGPVPLRLAELDPSPLLVCTVPQAQLESVLEERLVSLGVRVERERDVAGLDQDAEGVTLDVGDGASLRARYVVGCDGAHSVVRGFAGIGSTETTDSEVLRLGHFAAPTAAGKFETPEFHAPGLGTLRPGWNHTVRGRVLVTSLRPGVHLVGVREAAAEPPGTTTRAEFDAAVRRVLGADLPLGETLWLSRTVARAALADRYRSGRVFVAGDAAHLFPAGGSSLNVGLNDAVNLGWKLAAGLAGATDLLDTYEAERRPVGARTLMQTRAQDVLERLPGPDGDALRDLFGELVTRDQTLRQLGELVAGTDVRYPMPGPSHPLLGRFVPELDGITPLLRRARPLLLDLTGAAPDERAAPWAGRVDVVPLTCADPPADVLVVRPDGHVAFAGSGDPTDALATWFGPPDPDHQHESRPARSVNAGGVPQVSAVPDGSSPS